MNGAIATLDQTLVEEAERVEDLLAYHRNQVRCPVYTSVDVRRNRHKAAVVDCNAFPAGFNNLASRSRAQASGAIRSYMAQMYPGAQRLLVLGESHTRNKWYLQNLKELGDLFVAAGFDVVLGSMAEEAWPSMETTTAKGDTITLQGVSREGDELMAGPMVPDAIILNNDLSDGPPGLLDGIQQPVTPPPVMGWYHRSKSEHFRIVAELARQLGAYVGLDPWLMTAEHRLVPGVDWKGREGIDDVAAAVDDILGLMHDKYQQYGIQRDPRVFVKADAGTYGMGVMSVASAQDILSINSKGREKMDKGKGRVKTTRVIVQEGVTTDVRTEADLVAEPVLYMVCGQVVGGFNRVHPEKGADDSLNTPGSVFEPFLTRADGEPGPDERSLDPVSAHVYQVLGEVASIATGYELRYADQQGAALPGYP